jgi:hypothetical protein
MNLWLHVETGGQMKQLQKYSELKIDWATHDAAKYACENWHYSGCLPTGKLVKVGVWEDGKYIGVVLFGRGASPHLGTKFNLSQIEVCELVRIALREHKTPVSRIMAIAIKFLKASNSGLKLIVSFADPVQGHHGGVYQANNWIYSGKSNSTTEVFVDGKWRHMRGAFYKMTKETKTREVEGKHRYLMPLDNEMRNSIMKLSLPYPKRITKANSGDQSESGGAVPTDALQSQEVQL